MGKTTGISWTDHTFNPWIGCSRVSPGCAHCYAATQNQYRKWGAEWSRADGEGIRHVTSADYWKQPAKWNRSAEQDGVRRRVFCASLSDVFEDHPMVSDARNRLWDLIRETEYLDWLLLTKRVENVAHMVPRHWMEVGLPANIWLGTSIENQHWADRRIPVLTEIPARVRFLSCEPLLKPINLSRYLVNPSYGATVREIKRFTNGHIPQTNLEWIICGGESGAKHRPMKEEWAISLRDQCEAAGVAFFFKQWGGATSNANGHLLEGKEYHNFPQAVAA